MFIVNARFVADNFERNGPEVHHSTILGPYETSTAAMAAIKSLNARREWYFEIEAANDPAKLEKDYWQIDRFIEH
jgi:hypothetical protein